MTHEQFFILTYNNLVLETRKNMEQNIDTPRFILEEAFKISLLYRINKKVEEFKIQDSLERIPND